MTEEPIPWHPAFRQALERDLEDYRDALEFAGEVSLTAEPTRIDAVIRKKASTAVIPNPIADIFRGHNLFEFKSPTDYSQERIFISGLPTLSTIGARRGRIFGI